MTPDLGSLSGSDRRTLERARSLVDCFCADPATFGGIEPVPAARVPGVPRQLLDHRGHMTVTMERFHGCQVSLRVLHETAVAPGQATYAREILLVRPDGAVVQYGIVRLDLDAMPAHVAAEIRARQAPLGRILLDAGLLCGVQNVALLRIEAGPHLVAALGDADEPVEVFGRVAEILVAGRPAIELLEIVAPATAGRH